MRVIALTAARSWPGYSPDHNRPTADLFCSWFCYVVGCYLALAIFGAGA
jgi:hypothetical protein